jgi:hypothetical protein
MLAVACSRRSRLVGLLAVVVCVGLLVVPAAHAQGPQGQGPRGQDAGLFSDLQELANGLMALDPGKRIGGNTQVAVLEGELLKGVQGVFNLFGARQSRVVAAGRPARRMPRVNFMLGLARGQRLIGGHGHDQLGAHGHNSTIHGGRGHDLIHGGPGSQRLHGGHGHDLMHGGHGHDRLHGGRGHDHLRGGHGHDRMHGGPGHDRFHGGPGNDRFRGGAGNDRFVDREGASVVDAGAGRNVVEVADGSGDERVSCAAGSVNSLRVDRGDRLDPDCLGPLSVVRYGPAPSPAPAAHAAQNKPVTGDGSNDNPFTAECDELFVEDCVVSSFAERNVPEGLWSNEYVPAYQCPPTHPFLLDEIYAPAGTILQPGIEVDKSGLVGISITGISSKEGFFTLATRTATGFPNSSATNWALGGSYPYKVKLHCTVDPLNGYSTLASLFEVGRVQRP